MLLTSIRNCSQMVLAFRGFLVAKYQYHIRLSRPIAPDAIEGAKSELLRLFQSTDEPEVRGDDLKVTTPMEPPEAEVMLERLCVTHGPAWFASGFRELQDKS